MRQPIERLSKKIGEHATVSGFVQEIRVHSKILFVVLRERSGTLQIVVEKTSPYFESLSKLTRESVIEVNGKVVAAPQSGIEMQLESYTVLGMASPELPNPCSRENGRDGIGEAFAISLA